MVKASRWLVSLPLYAIRPETFGASALRNGNVQVDAVWFSRRRGVTRASAGYLWDALNPVPATLDEFLARYENVYGGCCEGRWDGLTYFAPNGAVCAVQEAHMAVLAPMLAAPGEVPAGYDGWWGFRD
jgi:hypothetical protein